MFIPTINIIDYKREDCTEIFAYAFSMFNKSSTVRNISIFEDLNVIQIGIKKDNFCLANLLIIW